MAAVANSGARIISGLSDGNPVLWHTAEFGAIQWTLEAGALVGSNVPVNRASGTRPRRIASLCHLSKQMSVQTGQAAEEWITREVGRALSAGVDRAAIYGAGDALEPLGF